MKVLFQARSDLFSNPGGDSVQVVNTKRELEVLGVAVDLSLDLRPELDGYDLVHLFNITKIDETAEQIANAKRFGNNVALSTIYWNFNEYKMYADTMLRMRQNPYRKSMHELVRIYSAISFRYSRAERKRRAAQARVLRQADILLPNSQGEMDLIREEFQINKPYHIVPNCADFEGDFSESKCAFIDIYGLSDFVLCVGNVAFRKNQLQLVKALKQTEIPLVIAGNFQEDWYEKECKLAAGSNTVFIGPVAHNDLPALYSAAKVHVLPSWFETPGLASLEAARFGCNIVTTDRGSTKEYFGNLAWYCDPTSRESIRHAVTEAYNAEKTDKLAIFVKNNYSWDMAGKATLTAYKKLLD